MKPIRSNSAKWQKISKPGLQKQNKGKTNYLLCAFMFLMAFFALILVFLGETKPRPKDQSDFASIPFLSPQNPENQPNQDTTTTTSHQTNTPTTSNTSIQSPQNQASQDQTTSQPSNTSETSQTGSNPVPSNTTSSSPTNTSGSPSTTTQNSQNHTSQGTTTLPPPNSTPGAPSGPVIKGTEGKRTKFDNPLPHDAIGHPIIPIDQYIPHLEIQWTAYGRDHLSVVIRDADKDRYEVPFEDPYPRPRHDPLPDLDDSQFDIDFQASPFKLVIERKSTGEVIFEMIDRLVYSDLYIEFSVRTPTNNLYGFGERTRALQYSPGTYTLYIIDRSGRIDPGLPGYNTNGHQSLYLMAERSKKYHICMFRNLNSQELHIIDGTTFTWKTVGGVLDLNFFLGETPEQAVENYHEYLGGWTLPALWHLGSHQSKWRGYKNTDDLEYVLNEYERVKVPLDGLWSDLDIFAKEANLWYDDANYPSERTAALYKKHKKHWIPVIQEYVPEQRESHAWTFPNVNDIMIKDGQDPSKPAFGIQYNGLVYFVDNWHPQAEAFWHEMYDYLDSKVPVSGLWLDANEVTTFLHINWPKANRHDYSNHIDQDRSRKYYNLPFYPGSENPYDVPIIDVDALHYGGIVEYNVRSLNSFLQSKHAYTYLQKKGFYFPFVISRGNTMGIGKYAYHFIPDVNSQWDHMRVGTAQTNLYNIFGMPVVGPDICGMGGQTQTNPELCARWYQIATFYGFARNQHGPQNVFNFQEPYRYTGVYFNAIAASVKLRYSYLKQFYAVFFQKKKGLLGFGTFFRPLFFGFPTDAHLPPYGHHVHEDQFMVGDLLMVAPAVYPGATTVEAYIPFARWFDLRNYKEVPPEGRGEIKTQSAQLTELPPHFLRGGYILFKQDTEGVMRSADLNNIFKVIVGLDDLKETASQKLSSAVGHILSASNYEEKYIYENCGLKSCMLKITATYELNKNDKTTIISLKIESVEPGSTLDAIEVDEIDLLGVATETLQNIGQIDCSGCSSGEPLEVNAQDGWIKINPMKLQFKDGASYSIKLSKI